MKPASSAGHEIRHVHRMLHTWTLNSKCRARPYDELVWMQLRECSPLVHTPLVHTLTPLFDGELQIAVLLSPACLNPSFPPAAPACTKPPAHAAAPLPRSFAPLLQCVPAAAAARQSPVASAAAVRWRHARRSRRCTAQRAAEAK